MRLDLFRNPIRSINRLFLAYILSISSIVHGVQRTPPQNNTEVNSYKKYLLPKNHPLQKKLKQLFENSSGIFRSTLSFKKAGFNVKVGLKIKSVDITKQLMVGSHPSIPGYLIKKYPDSMKYPSLTLQLFQLKNYITRIKGAQILSHYVEKLKLKHIVIPKKWLYRLPGNFPPFSHLLIVEKMDIYDDWDDPNGQARKCYYNMDKEVLTELCHLLHAVKGCDSIPRNQPFTRSGKIAFIDTEDIGHYKGHFFKHLLPALNPQLQEYATDLWERLERDPTKN